MWKDEARLAENVVARGPGELFGVLDSAQAAPWGFLIASDGLASAFGPSAETLRALPLLASVAALCVFAVFLRERFDQKAWTLVALMLLAFAPALVYQAAEFKPYSVDVLIVCVLLWVWHRYELRWPTILVGTISVWVSFPSVFLLAGLGLERLKRSTRDATVAGSVWLVSFLPYWWVVLRPTSEGGHLQGFWQEGFAPPPPDLFEWLYERAIGFFHYPAWFAVPSLALALATFGAWRLSTRDVRLTHVLAITVTISLIASALSLYPLASRPLIFLVPVGALIVAAGADVVFRFPEPARGALIAALTALLLFNLVVSGMMAGCATKSDGERDYAGCLKG